MGNNLVGRSRPQKHLVYFQPDLKRKEKTSFYPNSQEKSVIGYVRLNYLTEKHTF